MASKPMNMFEKLANMGGVLFRYHKAQFPRRVGILRSAWKHELAPPKQADWPVIKAHYNAVVKTIETGAYRQFTLREAAIYTAVLIEIVAWFFVGEMIGRRYIFGYMVPSDYVSKDTRNKVKQLELEKNH